MTDTGGVLTWRETLEVANADAAPLVLFLEPWAEPFVIPPHSAIEVVAYAPSEGRLEVDNRDNQVTIWGWTGSSVHVLQDGRELNPVFLPATDAAKIARERTHPPIIRQKDRATGT